MRWRVGGLGFLGRPAVSRRGSQLTVHSLRVQSTKIAGLCGFYVLSRNDAFESIPSIWAPGSLPLTTITIISVG